jgi:NADPH-dependent 2,4-dienoyl-CoA reductase/sulfur reductase-like enzyme
VAKDAGPLAADAIEVDAMFQTSEPGLYAAGDAVVQQAPSVATAIAAGSTAAATLIQSLAAEGHSQPAPTTNSKLRETMPDPPPEGDGDGSTPSHRRQGI